MRQFGFGLSISVTPMAVNVDNVLIAGIVNDHALPRF
jgi:hypothetical protein